MKSAFLSFEKALFFITKLKSGQMDEWTNKFENQSFE